jgi:toxin ParE1/3/4
MLISNCQEIADNPLLGKNYDGITQNLLGLKPNRHNHFLSNIERKLY